MCAPSGTSSGVRDEPNSAAASARVQTGPTQTSSSPKCSSQSARVRVAKHRCELRRERLLVVVVLALAEIATLDELAEPPEELRLERADREVAAVGRFVDAVAGEPAREHPWDGLAAEPVGDEVVGAVRHRDDDPRALARFARARGAPASTCVTAPSAPAARSAI